MAFRIQPFSSEYQSEVIAVIKEIQENEFQLPLLEGQKLELESISTSYQKDKGNFWVALFNEKVVGTIAAVDVGYNTLELRDVFLLPEYRGKEKGFAKQLLDTVIAWSKDNNIQDIYLGTTDFFKRAHSFYEKHGFKQIAREEMPSYCKPMECDTKFYRLALRA